MTSCRDCGRRYPAYERGGHCTSCHESFSSDRLFDQHRVGRFEAGERRCLTVVQMHARGWVQRRHGYWGAPGTRPVPTAGGDLGASGTASGTREAGDRHGDGSDGPRNRAVTP